MSGLDSPARVKGLLAGGLAPRTSFCPVGSGGHNSQPLRIQFPSPGGVDQVRGEVAASETPVRPGEQLAQRGPRSGSTTRATTRNLISSPLPMRPSTVDHYRKDPTSQPLLRVVTRSPPPLLFPGPGDCNLGDTSHLLGHPGFGDCDSGPGLPFPNYISSPGW